MSISANPSTTVTSKVHDSIEEVALLDSVNDDHDDVIVEMKDPMDSAAFLTLLRKSLTTWRMQGKKSIWIKLHIKLANLIEAAVKEGFWYHHAEPNYLMLVRWLLDTEHTIPANASHRVRVGAFVMNEKREILVVQEKNGILRGMWKFPTGVIEQGEDIHVGAMREIKEETGIDTEFVEILAFRQSHNAFFEKSDFFFMCMLRPLSRDICIQELEIEAAQWMPVEEYAAQPSVQNNDLFKYILDVSLARVDKLYAGLSPVHTRSVFSDTKDCFYLNSSDLNWPSRIGN
ncbi:nudix hydrolase 2 isoform X2 [Canna indica]|uniref:Nudix hydrolase 2 isoform X2 n=1 Tax=Canna indica TaxID=4628 RepID=A0AAQ3JUY9_9LILI|nr:nudix hydrolase 2 isoform X2 [Canna indica]